MWIISVILLVFYSVQDIREQKISCLSLLAGFGVVFVRGILLRENNFSYEWWDNICWGLTGMLPGAILLLLAILAKGCIGTGDGLVLALLGFMLGIKRAWWLLVMAFFFSFLYGCTLVVLKKKRKEFPFVPFYLPAIILLWCSGG